MTRRVDSRRHSGIELSLELNLDWQTDTVVINHDGQQVWLKDAFTSKGQRIGVATCCLESEPCEWHRALASMQQLRRGFPLTASKSCH